MISFQVHLRQGSLDHREEGTYDVVQFYGHFRKLFLTLNAIYITFRILLINTLWPKTFLAGILKGDYSIASCRTTPSNCDDSRSIAMCTVKRWFVQQSTAHENFTISRSHSLHLLKRKSKYLIR